MTTKLLFSLALCVAAVFAMPTVKQGSAGVPNQGSAAAVPGQGPAVAPNRDAPLGAEPIDADCGRLVDGNYPMSRENSCSKLYISCVGGLSIPRECPAELRFDEISGNCLVSKWVQACGGTPTTTLAPEDQPEQPTVAPVDFDCTGLEDGFFAAGYAPCTNEFFSCVGGVAQAQKCATELLSFDVVSKRCMQPEYIEACGGTPTEVPAPDQPQEPAIIEFSCEGKELGNHPNPDAECSDVFWSCIGNVAGVRRTCVDRTFFDVELNQCLFFDQVPECSGTPRPPVQEEEPKEPKATLPPVDFDCTGLPAGNHPDPKAQDGCSKMFFACDEAGIASEFTCAGETYFDQELKVCLFFVDVPECSGTPRPPPAEVTEEPIQQEQPTPVDFDCSGLEDGNYLKQDEPCSNVFFQCVSGTATMITCPTQGLRFDLDMDACVTPIMVPACQTSRAYYGQSPAPVQQIHPTEPIILVQPTQPEIVTPAPTTPAAAPEVDPATCANGYNPSTRSCNPPPAPEVPEVVDPASCVNGYNPATRSCIETGLQTDAAGKTAGAGELGTDRNGNLASAGELRK